MGIIYINNVNEFNELITKEQNIIIDFFAEWCGPCRSIAPYFEELMIEYTHIKFAKVNVDIADELCLKLKVSTMPTFLLIQNQKETARFSGAHRDELLKLCNSV